MTLAVALFAVVASLGLIVWFRVPALARAALAASRDAFHVLRDPALDEPRRERAVRSHARQLLRLCLRLTLTIAGAVLLPWAAVAWFDVAGWVDLDAVLASAVSPWVVLAALLVSVGAWRLRVPRP